MFSPTGPVNLQLERFTRKFQEQYLAIQVEKKTDKDTILENYLNTINLGAGAYGVQAAARTNILIRMYWILTF